MVIQLVHNTFHYEMEKLTRSFFPDRTVTVWDDGAEHPAPDDPVRITVAVPAAEGDSSDCVSASYEDTERNFHVSHTEPLGPLHDTELACGRALWHVLNAVTGVTPKWGILTGVRPSKLLIMLTDQYGRSRAEELLAQEYLVAPEKIRLASAVADKEAAILAESTPDSYSLYIGIPFCPNRCSYCSFVSSAISTPAARKLFPAYFEKLLEEVRVDAALAKECGLKLRSVYVGGGTPSTLSAEQIRTLLALVQKEFDFSNADEFTFEAGRPDTITAEKLRAIKEGGVDRISINPQTMTDELLAAIGRDHTVAQIEQSFREAREVGFNNINMDLIAGLPGDSPENFRRSLEAVLALCPESVTVHTLAYKRSATWDATTELFSRGQDTADMVDTAGRRLTEEGYEPYYMYRQARSVGNLENVGWAKPGFESKYNVYMMEECHSIFACGAGAVTKLRGEGADGPYLKRVGNFKYPFEYINRFDQLLANKEKIRKFYSQQ